MRIDFDDRRVEYIQDVRIFYAGKTREEQEPAQTLPSTMDGRFYTRKEWEELKKRIDLGYSINEIDGVIKDYNIKLEEGEANFYYGDGYRKNENSQKTSQVTIGYYYSQYALTVGLDFFYFDDEIIAQIKSEAAERQIA
jgi:hypothetical protein